jgi:hypothetical protein
MVFSGKEGITLVFFVFFDQICTTLLIFISNHAFFVCFKYKCHIINFLLTSLARYVQRNIQPRSFCVRYFPVQTSCSINKKLEMSIKVGVKCGIIFNLIVNTFFITCLYACQKLHL